MTISPELAAVWAAIQDDLGIAADGIPGIITATSVAARLGIETAVWNPPVVASSFADPADIAAFYKCKATGKSDQECFKKGDNGIGKWGHFTAQSDTPMCALPYEVWQRAGKTGGAPVEVRYRGVSVTGILGDSMPHLFNITNGAGIDLNPAFAARLGLKPPFLVEGVQWRWI